MIADKPIIFWFQVLQMVPKLKPRRDKAFKLARRLKERLHDMGFPEWVG